MNYLERYARRIQEGIPAELMPAEDARGLFRIYAVLAFAVGPAVEARDVHNAWVAWMAGLRPDHPALVPFEDLPPELAAQDAPFVEAIRRAAQQPG